MKNLTKVALRQQAVFIPSSERRFSSEELRDETAVLVANLAQLGYGVTEALLTALNQTTPYFQSELLKTFREVMGVHKNWTPLVKNWKVPTQEGLLDYLVTFFANVFRTNGATLPCGHIIPDGSFPLERYNGCPYCKTPFEFGKLEHVGQGSKLKVLELWDADNIDAFLADLLSSKTALNATQMDSLKLLMKDRELPQVEIGMKETLMAVIDHWIEKGMAEKAQPLFRSPMDILRYLWYKHTGFLQIIEPKTIWQRKSVNRHHLWAPKDQSAMGAIQAKADLKLKYSRPECRRVALWLNNLDLPVVKMAEMMHPKRGMWIRFIRALRLPEYSKRPGFEHLKELLDVFYNQSYEVWAGRVNHFRLRADVENTMELLKKRPGLFARSLFSNMLWFGPEAPVKAFGEIVDQVPARLVFTLNSYAANYFTPKGARAVKPLGGVNKSVPEHPLLKVYDEEQRKAMKASIEDLCLLAMRKRFAAQQNPNKTIFIDPDLFKIPVSIGDRSNTVQDLPSALMGARFPMEGDQIRLFMQWGEGLPAQELDMDLSCSISYPNGSDYCSYNKLTTTGCQHSGDIIEIPHMIGTAEYINIDLPALREAGAEYVTFTCNAYSVGEIAPNLVVGWMESKHKMEVSEETGVAYDPSCVQHQIRVTKSLTKGLVFGVLDVQKGEIIWLEMDFDGQEVEDLNTRNVRAMLAKLDSKLTVGTLLQQKAQAQNLRELDRDAPETPDEAYSLEWALNAAAVTRLLVD